MGYCAALNCRNGTSGAYKNSSVRFYGFPLQNKPLLRQWIQNMGRTMGTPSKYQRLCSEHFEESAFETDPLKTRKRRRLLKEAVPNKFILGGDGTWLVGTPQASSDVMGKKTRKRIRISEPCRVPGTSPQWPHLQDWQNEFYKQLLKEKFGPWITLGKDCPVPKSHFPAEGAAQVEDPQDLEGGKFPASLSTGRGGATIQGAGGTQEHGSPSGASRALHHQVETSGSRRDPAANPAEPVGIGSGTGAPAGQQPEEFGRLLLCPQGRPEAGAVPSFICTECGRNFAPFASLLQHRHRCARAAPWAVPWGKPPSAAT